jgi:2Fe-2S ferredoxin
VYVREGVDSLSEQQENEEDILDKAFDVRPTSRLGCQSMVSDEDVTVEITRESRQAWMDEHPEERAKLKQAR